jgi:uncharacterized protein YigE (DUF2233 family)
MIFKKNKIFYSVLTILAVLALVFSFKLKQENDLVISKIVDLKKEEVRFYWKDNAGNILGNFQNLTSFTKKNNKKLLFAMNGGMYKKDLSPQGLYIVNKIEKQKIDTTSGSGNFYLKPNGVFLITKNVASISITKDFKNKDVDFATQSGPMLVIDGKIHPEFQESSKNLNIRNGVGVLPNGNIIFAISKEKINFYNFANYFKKLGCKNALYLDGFVSRIYYPEKEISQFDSNFGVMIGVLEK